MSSIGLAIKAFFGGGSSVLYAFLLAGGAGFYFHYKDVVKDKKEFKARVELLENSLDNFNKSEKSQLLQRKEEDEHKIKQQDLEEAIRQAPDSSHCGASESIVLVFDKLRDKWQPDSEASSSSE